MTTIIENFYSYANKEWLDSIDIPNDLSGISNFTIVEQENNKKIKELITTVSESSPIKIVYDVFMNTERLEKEGITPMKTWIDRINVSESINDMVKIIVDMQLSDISSFFSIYISEDVISPGINRFTLGYGQLLIPGSFFYDSQFSPYVNTLRYNLQTMSDTYNLDWDVDDIIEFDSRISQLLPINSSKMNKTYEFISVENFIKKMQSDFWTEYFHCLNASSPREITDLICVDMAYYIGLSNILSVTELSTLKMHTMRHLFVCYSGFMDSQLFNLNFEFYGKALHGHIEPSEREDRCLAIINYLIGSEISRIYTEKYCNNDDKKIITEMVDNIISVYKERLQECEWLSIDAKKATITKLEQIIYCIGYPSKWRNYDGLQIDRDMSMCTIANNIILYNNIQQLKLIDQPVESDIWNLMSHDTNACYNCLRNELIFPAGILQPPFFDIMASIPQNYGRIGCLIAHELFHAIDEQGSHIDGKGKIANLWKTEDAAYYKVKSDKMIKQADAAGLPGRGMLRENLADLEGLRTSLMAMKKTINCTSEDLREFFLSYASLWRNKRREELQEADLHRNHSAPGEFRSNIVYNLNEFYQVFDMKTHMPPEERVILF